MKKYLSITTVISFLLILTSCPSEPGLTSEKSITAFSFKASANSGLAGDVSGTISGTNISLTLPDGTIVTGLVASFTAIGESVAVGGTAQVSGTTANDFSSPVVYTVTAADGSTQDYTVSVTIEAAVSTVETETRTANLVSFDMNRVPAGCSFTMSEHLVSSEYAVPHTVTLTKSYWMGKTEVPQGLWEDVWGTDWPGTDPDGSGYGSGNDYPAYYIDWFDTAAFCNLLTIADDSITVSELVYFSDIDLLSPYSKDDAADHDPVYVDWNAKGYRMPTEAEWECAARYVDGTQWNCGDHISGDTEYACLQTNTGVLSGSPLATEARMNEYAWSTYNNTGSAGDPGYGNKKVGQKLPNALGLYDMNGNIWEWCHDWYAKSSVTAETDPTGSESGSYRVSRGGSWSVNRNDLRSAQRGLAGPAAEGNGMGFRLCRTAD